MYPKDWTLRGSASLRRRHPELRGSGRPLDKLADPRTPVGRSRAHMGLDGLWRSCQMSRSAAYCYLADAAGRIDAQTHVGLMGGEDCRTVIEVATHGGE